MLAVRCELLLGSYQAADPFGPPMRLSGHLTRTGCMRRSLQPHAKLAASNPARMRLRRCAGWRCRRRRRSRARCVPSRRTAATSWVPRNPTAAGSGDRYLKAGSAVNRVDRASRRLCRRTRL